MNGLKAALVHKKVINLKQFGLSETNTADKNSSIIYNAFFLLKNGGEIILPTGVFNINPITIDFGVQGLTFRGFARNNSVLNITATNQFAITFLQTASYLRFEDFSIYCNNVANGIAFEDNDNKHGAIDFSNIYISNCHEAYKLHDVVYFIGKRISASITANATINDYGIDLKGYEYNYFYNCSFQNNNSNDELVEHDLIKITDTQYVYFDHCELAKCGNAGFNIKSENVKNKCIYISNTILYKLKYGILIDNSNSSSEDISITNCNVHLLGNSVNERAVYVKTANDCKTANLTVNNTSVFRLGVNSSSLMEFEENSISGGLSLINIANLYNKQASVIFNNNVADNLSFSNTLDKGIITISADGSATAFDVILYENYAPYMPNLIPQILLNPIGLNDSKYSVTPSYYDSGQRLRCQIIFDEPLKSGEYQIRYKVIY